jgi:hypothetical protein
MTGNTKTSIESFSPAFLRFTVFAEVWGNNDASITSFRPCLDVSDVGRRQKRNEPLSYMFSLVPCYPNRGFQGFRMHIFA